jgi:hypothetical protein
VTDELREVWVCVGDGCTMRVSNASGRPIPRPKNWDDECCPHCQVKRAFKAGGSKAAREMAVKLRLEDGRTNRAFAGRGLRGERPSEKPKREQAHRTPEEVEVLREKVREVITANPDVTAKQIGEAVGITTRTATRYRDHLGLGHKKEPTAKQREQIMRVLLDQPPMKDDEVAKEVGVKVFTVTEVRQKKGIPPCRTRVKEDRERRVAEVATEHPKWGYKRIAAFTGESLNSTRRALDKFRKSDPAEPVSAAV